MDRTEDLSKTLDEIDRESIQRQRKSPLANASKASSSSSTAFVVLKADEIFVSGLTASLVPLYRGSESIQLLHKGVPFLVSCANLKIRFAINGKFHD